VYSFWQCVLPVEDNIAKYEGQEHKSYSFAVGRQILLHSFRPFTAGTGYSMHQLEGHTSLVTGTVGGPVAGEIAGLPVVSQL